MAKTQSVWVGDVIPELYRSERDVVGELTKAHEKQRANDEASRLLEQSENRIINTLLKRLDDSPLPEKCKIAKRSEIINMSPGWGRDFNPSEEEAAAILKTEFDREFAEQLTGQHTTMARLALCHRYEQDLRELRKLRQQGRLRLQTS